jgi:hypothetical protein
MLDADLLRIHGFWSSTKTWNPIVDELSDDSDLRGLRIHAFSYESPKLPRFGWLPFRIPDYNDVAQSLPAYIAAEAPGEAPLVIITHSQGGLVLQRFLAWMLNEGRANELARIRSIIMLSCPNEGTEYLRSLRAMIGVNSSPQGSQLKVLVDEVGEARRIVLRQIVNAAESDDRQYRIPFHVYSGRTDNVVSRRSAQSVFPTAETLPGNHFTILDPASEGSLTVSTLKRHIVDAVVPHDSDMATGPARDRHRGLQSPMPHDRLRKPLKPHARPPLNRRKPPDTPGEPPPAPTATVDADPSTRRARIVILGLIVLMVCAAAIGLLALRSGTHSGVVPVTLLAVTVGAASAAFFLAKRKVPLDWPQQADQLLTALARDVSQQWQQELAARTLIASRASTTDVDRPIDVEWRLTDRPVAAAPDSVTMGAVGGRPTRLRMSGRLRELVTAYRGLPAHRLVIIGEPGAGKTILAARFTVDYLATAQVPPDAIPIILPAESWDAGDVDLATWIEHRLYAEYPASLDKIPRSEHPIRKLLKEGRIIAVLDGLDEMPEPVRPHAIRQINEAAASWPIVVTCRTQEYEQAVVQAGPLSAAIVAELRAVDPGEAIQYLSGSGADWHEVAQGWESATDRQVASALALRTPLMISLAGRVFDKEHSPAMLLDAGQFPDQASVETFLFGEYVRAAYEQSLVPEEKRAIDAERAEAHLTFLARHMNTLRTRDLAWWQLSTALSRRRSIASLLGFVSVTATAVALYLFGWVLGIAIWLPAAICTGLVCGGAAATAVRFGTIPGPPTRFRVYLDVKRSPLRELTRSGVVGAIIPAGIIGVLLGVTTGPFLGLYVGVALLAVVGVAAAIVRWSVPTQKAVAVSPRSILDADRQATLIRGLVIALLAGTILASVFVGISSRMWSGTFGGAAAGLLLAFGAMLGTSWSWYLAAKTVLAVRSDLPWRLQDFLEECYEMQVLRRVGSVYQFRHGRLQDYLSAVGPAGRPADLSRGRERPAPVTSDA